MVFTVINSYTNIVIARNPNSSKGYADYDEVAAEEENKRLEQEQQQFDYEKSTDNYLESLEVEGYEIAPEFDKQTLEYTIEKEVTEKTIEIKARTSHPSASIQGIGKIELKPGKNQYRIDVTAEFGTVRTYWITINRKGTKEEIRKAEEEKKEEERNLYGEDLTEPEVIQKGDNKKALLIGGLVVFFIICSIIIIKLKSKKRKEN